MDIIARVEVPLNNSGTCSYYIECCTEEEINAARKEAYNKGYTPHTIRLVPKKVDLKPTPAASPILFDLDDEYIII